MEPKSRFQSIGLNDGVIANTLKNKNLTNRLLDVLTKANVPESGCPKEKGNLYYSVASKAPITFEKELGMLAEYVAEEKFKTTKQIEEAVKFIRACIAEGKEFTAAELDKATGVGVSVDEKEIREVIAQAIEARKAEIMEEGYSYNKGKLLTAPEVKEKLMWADGKQVASCLKEGMEKLLGPQEEEKDGGKKKKSGKAKKAPPEENKKVQEEPEKDPNTIKLTDLMARELKAAVNSPALLKEHQVFTKGHILTRFPPEPNGYLHIGHAKAMRFSFKTASELGGKTYLRFDDTNPEKENQEFIDNIIENVKWMGYEPFKITHASDYFEELYNLAEELIKRGKAFVCEQSSQEIKEYRALKKDSPFRNRAIQDNLKMFRDMRKGKYEENAVCLRMKIDMTHDQAAMRDPVAYRIKYSPHPHVGDKWCIYPTYDYTHCINDSLEHIDYSLCTLEFEQRRDSYYWLLEALDLYRPHVWEFSRLNLEYAVVSKRKLMRLVKEGYVRGWDDPRFLTINGMRRRGYTPEAINNFCQEIGVTRRGNENVTSIKLLEHHVRKDLDKHAPRSFAVVRPVKLIIANVADDYDEVFKAPVFPTVKDSPTYDIHMTKEIWIDHDDFSEKNIDGFYGVMPSNLVRLRYTFYVRMKEVVKDDKGNVKHVVVERVDEEPSKKVKGFIQWVSTKYSMKAELRFYDYLFTMKLPEREANEKKVDWITYVNNKSETIESDCRVLNSLAGCKYQDHFQFERLGYFVVDSDTDSAKGKYVFNMTVGLRESGEKTKLFEKIKNS